MPCTLCPQNNKVKIIFSIILAKTDKIFIIKIGRLIPESTQDTNAVAFPTKPVYALTWDVQN